MKPLRIRDGRKGMNYLCAALIDVTVNTITGASEKKEMERMQKQFESEKERQQEIYEKEQEQRRLDYLMEMYFLEQEAEETEEIPIKELFPTGCGDIAVQAFFRDPELKVVINVLYEDKIWGPYYRKVSKDKDGKYYFTLDGEKWYFQKNHPEFKR